MTKRRLSGWAPFFYLYIYAVQIALQLVREFSDVFPTIPAAQEFTIIFLHMMEEVYILPNREKGVDKCLRWWYYNQAVSETATES